MGHAVGKTGQIISYEMDRKSSNSLKKSIQKLSAQPVSPSSLFPAHWLFLRTTKLV